MQTFEIRKNEAGQRFDKYLRKLLSEAPASFIYKMLRKKNIVLNGKRADGSEKLRESDEVKLFLSEETFARFASPVLKSSGGGSSQTMEDYPYRPLDIVYEDEDILIINKPSGMLSQKAKADDISANEYIIGYLLHQHAIEREDLATFVPSVCNRLDRNTSGLLIAGKSLKGLQDMAKQLGNRQVEKYYSCLVKGRVKEPAVIEGWLCKEEESNQVRIFEKEQPDSRYIRTGYAPISCYRKGTTKNGKSCLQKAGEQDFSGDAELFTLLEVHLITGRSHQIRAHLASIGHPIVGDPRYGDKKENDWFFHHFQIQNQMLHASRMKFADGREFHAPPGREFARVLEASLIYIKN